jgi:ribosomal RNA-processing protein 17
MPPPTKRRRTEPTAVEEITFDPSARQEYLTGFHKRKLERASHAREQAKKQARIEKLEARKKVSGAGGGVES